MENIAITAVIKLRAKTHQKGFPFMISENTLPLGQFIYEYPNGKMFVCFFKESELVKLKELSIQEVEEIIKKHQLLEYA